MNGGMTRIGVHEEQQQEGYPTLGGRGGVHDCVVAVHRCVGVVHDRGDNVLHVLPSLACREDTVLHAVLPTCSRVYFRVAAGDHSAQRGASRSRRDETTLRRVSLPALERKRE